MCAFVCLVTPSFPRLPRISGRPAQKISRIHPRPARRRHTVCVPPRIHRICVAGEAGPVPLKSGRNADRVLRGCAENGLPLALKCGACLWGTHGWTGNWSRKRPFVTPRTWRQAREPQPWKRCRHPRRETEVARQKTPNGAPEGAILYQLRGSFRRPVRSAWPDPSCPAKPEGERPGRPFRTLFEMKNSLRRPPPSAPSGNRRVLRLARRCRQRRRATIRLRRRPRRQWPNPALRP